MGCCESKIVYICSLENISSLNYFLNRCRNLDVDILSVDYEKVKLIATKSDINILKRFCYSVYQVSHKYHNV